MALHDSSPEGEQRLPPMIFIYNNDFILKSNNQMDFQEAPNQVRYLQGDSGRGGVLILLY
jgi:hypothetical protein